MQAGATALTAVDYETQFKNSVYLAQDISVIGFWVLVGVGGNLLSFSFSLSLAIRRSSVLRSSALEH